MGPEEMTSIIQQTILVAVQISAPILLISFILGLLISLLMSVTQISETTLIFIPKLLAFCLTLAVCFPWMLKVLMRFTHELLITQWDRLITLSYYSM